MSWTTNVFIRAYMGDRDAIMEVANALDGLTDGHFSQMFDVAKHAIFTSMIRIPTGVYYVNGKKRDIRDYDLTAMCNRFASNPQEIHNWINTFDLNRGVSEPTLVTTREGYIEHAISNQCEINSYARRLTFGAEFLAAFSSAIAACKVNTQVNTPLAAEQLRIGMVAPATSRTLFWRRVTPPSLVALPITHGRWLAMASQACVTASIAASIAP